MNDPTCPASDNERHVCADKFGQAWDRPGIGPRPGTRCETAIAIEQQVDAARDILHAEREERMAALGDLFASTMPDPDDEDRCESGLAEYAGLAAYDAPPDPDRVTQLMVDLEASIQAARSKREEAKAVAEGLFRQAFGRNP